MLLQPQCFNPVPSGHQVHMADIKISADCFDTFPCNVNYYSFQLNQSFGSSENKAGHL